MDPTVIYEKVAPQASGSCQEPSEAEVGGPSTRLVPVHQIGCRNEEIKGNGDKLQSLQPSTYFLKSALLDAFSSVGATAKHYTLREILGMLKAYLSQNPFLIDSIESQFVNCGGTQLATAFGVDRFQYSEVRYLLSQSITRASYITYQSPSFSQKASSSQNTCRPNSNPPIFIAIPKIPECQSGPESDYSCQGYETAFCHDSDDELPLSVSGESGAEGEAEDVEYEPATEEDANRTEDSVDSESDIENLILILGVDDQPDSAEDFFADDESDTSTDEGSDNLSEDEGDQWSCLTCGIKNKPFFRYCLKCWQLRKDWYPEPPKKRRKRKPRPKKDKRRIPSQEKQVVNAVSSETKQESKDDFMPSYILEREGSTASCTTQASSTSWVSSSGTSSSQDSGFGSQDLLTFETTPSPSLLLHKRKASEMEDSTERKNETPRNGESAVLDEDDRNFLKLFRKFKNFAGSVNGFRWLSSSQADSLREALSNLTPDLDLEEHPPVDRCTICCARPKDASIIHGRISHIGFCYPCAKRLYKSKARCPLCRRRIHMITKNSYA